MANPITRRWRALVAAMADLTEAERIQLLGFLGLVGIVAGLIAGVLLGYLIWGQ